MEPVYIDLDVRVFVLKQYEKYCHDYDSSKNYLPNYKITIFDVPLLLYFSAFIVYLLKK